MNKKSRGRGILLCTVADDLFADFVQVRISREHRVKTYVGGGAVDFLVVWTIYDRICADREYREF